MVQKATLDLRRIVTEIGIPGLYTNRVALEDRILLNGKTEDI